jgi:hypothetical protein
LTAPEIIIIYKEIAKGALESFKPVFDQPTNSNYRFRLTPYAENYYESAKSLTEYLIKEADSLLKQASADTNMDQLSFQLSEIGKETYQQYLATYKP